MGTRSIISVKKQDGSYASIYCHWDGYPSHAGKILVENYGDQEKAECLMALGSLSSIYASPEKPDGHSYETPVAGYCVAYGRDRGELGQEAVLGATLKDVQRDMGQDYEYLWDGSQWLCDGEPMTLNMIS